MCIFHLCPPLNLFNMTHSLSMLTFMLSSKSAQFLGYMDLRTSTMWRKSWIADHGNVSIIEQLFVTRTQPCLQVVQLQWASSRLLDRSQPVMCWLVMLMVSLSRVTSGLTVVERSSPLQVLWLYRKVHSAWPVQQPATRTRRAQLLTTSLELLSVNIENNVIIFTARQHSLLCRALY